MLLTLYVSPVSRSMVQAHSPILTRSMRTLVPMTLSDSSTSRGVSLSYGIISIINS